MNSTSTMTNLAHQIDWILILKWISVIINLTVFIKWLASKVVLNQFLLGRWEGNIIRIDNPLKLNCILIITSSPTRSNKAFFYYEQLQSEKIIIRGVDELDDYEDDWLFAFNRKWSASFYREFHVAYNEKMQGEQIDATETVHYHWNCTIHNIFFKPKIKVNILGNGINFVGVLHKS